MRPLLPTFAASLALLCACSGPQAPHYSSGGGLVIPTSLGEGSGDDKAARDSSAKPKQTPNGAAPATSGSAIAAASGSAIAPAQPAKLPAPPDPEALRTADQVEYSLIYENGAVRVGSVRRLRFAEPRVTERKMGRFAVELWVGRELIERVRFDFPLLAAEEPRESERHPVREPPPLTKGPLHAQVLVPFSERTRRAVLLDRATGKESELEWPPVARPAGEVVK